MQVWTEEKVCLEQKKTFLLIRFSEKKNVVFIA